MTYVHNGWTRFKDKILHLMMCFLRTVSGKCEVNGLVIYSTDRWLVVASQTPYVMGETEAHIAYLVGT